MNKFRMGIVFVGICLIVITSGCSTTGNEKIIDKDHAIAIAHDDALKSYGNLDNLEVNAVFSRGEWKIDYELKNKKLNGGVPHYRIDAKTGEIKHKIYEQ